MRTRHAYRLAARSIATVIAIGAMAACGGSAVTGVSTKPSRLVLSPDSVSLTEGQSTTLQVQVLDASGRSLSTTGVQLSSSDSAVASVNAAGVVDAVGPGVATVQATLDALTATAHVDVIGHPVGASYDSVALSGRPFGVAVSPNDVAYVTQLDGGTVASVDIANARIATLIGVGKVPTAVAFNPTGSIAYVTNQIDSNVGVVSVTQSTQTSTVPLSHNTFAVAVAPDGKRVYVTDNDTLVFVLDAATRAVTDSVVVGNAPNGFAFAPNDTILYVSSFMAGTVSEIDVKSDQVLRTFTVGGTPQDLVVSPDGTKLFIANEAGALDVWDLQADQLSTSVALAGGGFGLAMSPDHARLFVTEPGAGEVQVVDPSTLQVLGNIMVGGTPRRVAFDHRGATAVISNEMGWVDLVH